MMLVEEGSGPEDTGMTGVYAEIYSTCAKFDGILEKINNLPPINSQGLSILDVKTDTVLSYLINLTYLILRKCCGQSILENEIREQLVHMRVILERIKPLEEKLKYQIDKLIKTGIAGKRQTGKSGFRANVADLESNESEQDDEKCGEMSNDGIDERVSPKVYKPPKLAAVPYNDARKEEKQRELLQKAKRRALNSSVMRELKEEYLDTPLEISMTNTLRNTQTKYRKEKEKYEETYFTRLPVTKKEKHRDRLMNSATLGVLSSQITRFEDLSALEGRLPNVKRKQRRSMKTKKLRSGKKRRTI